MCNNNPTTNPCENCQKINTPACGESMTCPKARHVQWILRQCIAEADFHADGSDINATTIRALRETITIIDKVEAGEF